MCPWRLLLYADEIVPGNPLRPDNKRKVWVIYASWLELGDLLYSENAWLAVGVIRNHIVKTVRGGISNVIRALLRECFAGACSLSSAGAMLPSGALFFCKYHRFISDEAAGKAVWCSKGHGPNMDIHVFERIPKTAHT